MVIGIEIRLRRYRQKLSRLDVHDHYRPRLGPVLLHRGYKLLLGKILYDLVDGKGHPQALGRRLDLPRDRGNELHRRVQDAKKDLEDIHIINNDESSKLKEAAEIILKIEDILRYLETTFTSPES